MFAIHNDPFSTNATVWVDDGMFCKPKGYSPKVIILKVSLRSQKL